MSAGSVNYRNAIRAPIRGFWSGAWDYNQFTDGMVTAIHMGIPTAWYEGAAACGIAPADLSPEEKAALRQAIFHEENYIARLAQVVEAGSKANGGKLGPLMARAAVWINRYHDIVNRAKVAACGDIKLEWVHNALFVTKEPCNTCANKLNGKVKRASYWKRTGVQPQNPVNPFLDCEGWRCSCALLPTDKPLSKGPLPRLP